MSWIRETAITLGLLGIAGAAIGWTQPSLASAEVKAKEGSDIYLLPPDEQLALMSLGYRSALADLLWSEVLINQGIRMTEKRGFENSGPLVHAVITLDPSFREPYRLADSIVTFQAVATGPDTARITRQILEAGVKQFPNDAELWLNLGQFVAYLGPDSILKDEAEKAEWKETGARYMARAAELGSDKSFAWLTLSGAGLYGRAGKRDAQIRYYERLLSTTDDDELRAYVSGLLKVLLGEAEFDQYRQRDEAFNAVWRTELPGTNKVMALILGHPRDPAECAGIGGGKGGADCARTWKDWAAETQRDGR